MFGHWRERDFSIFAVRDGSRFGRRQSIFAEVVDRTLDTGAKIFTLNDGLIDSSKGEMFIMAGGFAARREVRQLVERRKTTMDANRRNGLPPSPRLLRTHVKIRDDKGKIIGVKLDESKRQMFDDLAALVLEGLHWRQIEAEMFVRFGYGRKGKSYHPSTFQHLMYKPTFWGHSAQQFIGTKLDLWRIEEGHPIPDGVLISYNVMEPVYRGELSEAVRAEMRRRKEIGHGKGRRNTVWMRGLFVCAGCGYNAVTLTGKSGRYVRCISNQRGVLNRHCDQPAHLPERTARAYVTALLERMIELGADTLTEMIQQSGAQVRPDIGGIRRELERLDERMRRAIRQRLEFEGTNVEAGYTEELRDLDRQLTAQKARLAEAEVELARHRQPEPVAIEELKRLNSDGFWEQSEDKRNQMLHRLLGDLRLVIDYRTIVGLTWKS